jgi:hypothetical protein
MSLVQSTFARFLYRADPIAKGSSTTVAGQRFKATADGIALVSVASNGGLVRVTATGHGLPTNTYVTIYGASGSYATSVNNTASNPAWLITVITANTFDLVGSTYTGAVTTGTIVATMVGSVDGTRFTRQRQLAIYNTARMVLFNALYESKTPDQLDKLVSGTALNNQSLTIAAASSNFQLIAKPTGFLKLIRMVDSQSPKQRINILPSKLLQDVAESITTAYTSTTSNILAFEIGANWAIYCGDTAVATSPAITDYFAITDWVWVTHIMPNTYYESFRDDLEPILIEIACAVADEQSNADVMALAKTLLNKRN